MPAGQTSRIATAVQQLTLGDGASEGSSLHITLDQPQQPAGLAAAAALAPAPAQAQAAPASSAGEAAAQGGSGAAKDDESAPAGAPAGEPAAPAGADVAAAAGQKCQAGGSGSESEGESDSESEEEEEDGGWVTAARTKNVQRRQKRRVGAAVTRWCTLADSGPNALLRPVDAVFSWALQPRLALSSELVFLLFPTFTAAACPCMPDYKASSMPNCLPNCTFKRALPLEACRRSAAHSGRQRQRRRRRQLQLQQQRRRTTPAARRMSPQRMRRATRGLVTLTPMRRAAWRPCQPAACAA